MPLALLALQLLAASPAGPLHDGRAGQTTIQLSQPLAEAVVDGRLDEPQWRSAARLGGFSVYQPVDGVAAPDSTEVLVWYSATALYVGIRAREPHGVVRATLADRDHIAGDDNLQLLLDTFDDRHRAFVFGVNPLGVQGDGIRSEGSGAGSAGGAPGQVDLSADFLYSSRGHVTADGYEVEMRIPFTALRFPARRTQRWGINVIRTVQHSGYTETWTPVKRASASFLAQSGVLTGLEGLKRGRVLLLNPELTARATGTPPAPATNAGWRYDRTSDVGGNAKWDVNSSLTLNGTIHPDFSQVESDAAQIATDPRFALFFPEKRPFFIDGIEQFDVPNRLVYTRRIVQPVGAVKLTGTVGGSDVALLAARDDRSASAGGATSPAFVIARLRRDVAGRATLGLLYTDREEGGSFNRVLGADARLLFGGLYYAQAQAVMSATSLGSTTRSAPLWEAVVDRTGRAYGFHYVLTGIGEDFVASSGFVPRVGYVKPLIANRFTLYGRPGALLENFTTRITADGTWRYRDFFAGRSVLEDHASVESSFIFRGGWNLTVAPSANSFGFDSLPYAYYAVAGPRDTVAFTAPVRLAAFGVKTSVSTPQYQHFAASGSVTIGRDVDFAEADAVRRRDASLSVDWRPTQQLRVAASYISSALARSTDGVVVSRARIPRLKGEYQVTRAVFFRLVGQYESRSRLSLADARTGLPIVLVRQGGYVFLPDASSNGLRADGLFSYQPSPGTVVFLGYGNSLAEADPLRFTGLRRVGDGFFAKVSWLLRG